MFHPQTSASPALDISAGWAGFAAESLIHHRTAGASVRFHVTPRFSVGPELTYMSGPGSDRDLSDAAARHGAHPPGAAGGYAARHLQRAYQEAGQAGYLWHAFGDSHLIIRRAFR